MFALENFVFIEKTFLSRVFSNFDGRNIPQKPCYLSVSAHPLVTNFTFFLAQETFLARRIENFAALNTA